MAEEDNRMPENDLNNRKREKRRAHSLRDSSIVLRLPFFEHWYPNTPANKKVFHLYKFSQKGLYTFADIGAKS